MAITQITAYDPVSNISVVEVDHESKSLDIENYTSKSLNVGKSFYLGAKAWFHARIDSSEFLR